MKSPFQTKTKFAIQTAKKMKKIESGQTQMAKPRPLATRSKAKYTVPEAKQHLQQHILLYDSMELNLNQMMNQPKAAMSFECCKSSQSYLRIAICSR
jgi:hypothetical protein